MRSLLILFTISFAFVLVTVHGQAIDPCAHRNCANIHCEAVPVECQGTPDAHGLYLGKYTLRQNFSACHCCPNCAQLLHEHENCARVVGVHDLRMCAQGLICQHNVCVKGSLPIPK